MRFLRAQPVNPCHIAPPTHLTVQLLVALRNVAIRLGAARRGVTVALAFVVGAHITCIRVPFVGHPEGGVAAVLLCGGAAQHVVVIVPTERTRICGSNKEDLRGCGGSLSSVHSTNNQQPPTARTSLRSAMRAGAPHSVPASRVRGCARKRRPRRRTASTPRRTRRRADPTVATVRA